LLASLALVDPELLETCPPPVMLGNALDAFTQLLESYLSTRASVFTDALALDGLRAFALGFQPIAEQPVRDYSQLAYAAMLSGICLTQAGLGSVHGFASPLGALFPIPHGMACGTMLAASTDMNRELLSKPSPNRALLDRYRQVARIINAEADDATESHDLVETLYRWTEQCQVPCLSHFGVKKEDIPRIVAGSRGSSMKTNPVVLTDEQLGTLLKQRL
jgi:alcohol dehydrogenase